MRKSTYLVIAIILLSFVSLVCYWTILPRTATLEFPGDGVYTGQLKGYTFHGQGTWTSEYNVTYKGEFKDGEFDGSGTMTFPNGATYVGDFKGGYMHGYGVMTFSDGHTHEGYWEADSFKGDCDDHDH